MAFRIKAAVSVLIAGAALLPAEDVTFNARHKHLHRGARGTLTFTPEAVRWQENGNRAAHSQTWRYEELQRLEISRERLRFVTYEDIRREFGRDQEYNFYEVPEGQALRLYAFLCERLDQRLMAHLADSLENASVTLPVKLLRGLSGANGTLQMDDTRVVFLSAAEDASRTWRYRDIAGISSTGPFDLTIETIEGENRFQLKELLPQSRYQDLWRKISEANGLQIYGSQLEHSHQN